MTVLFHVSGWIELSRAKVGDIFVLLPGPQHAEGPGVYFSEEKPRWSAAEGAKTPAAVVVIEANSSKDWWRTSPSIAKKFNRPRTWHSKGQSVACRVESVRIETVPFLSCSHQLVEVVK